MMYTPTPATRRPRPPRSLSRQRPPLVSSTSEPTKQKVPLLPTPSVSVDGDTPLSAYIKERQEDARNNLSRISASPADVSFALDINTSISQTDKLDDGDLSRNPSTSELQHADKRIVGLGISSSSSVESKISETSPPPPYGPNLTTLSSRPMPQEHSDPLRPSTPPRQDSSSSSRKALTSPTRDGRTVNLRQRSTTEGGEAHHEHERLIDEGDYRKEEVDDDLTEGEMKARFKEMKLLLQSREEELFVAARVAEQALKSHEQVLAILPKQFKGQLPHLQDIYTPLSPVDDYPSTTSTQHGRLLSFPSPQSLQFTLESPLTIPSPDPVPHSSQSTQLFRTVRDKESTRPFAIHHHKSRPSIFTSHSSTSAQIPTPRYTRLAALQAEAEERIMALEEALSEAQEGEEKQRKIAARWRKEVDKMQRELVKVDEQRAENEQQALRESVVGHAGWRRKSQESEMKQTAQTSTTSEETSHQEKRLGWGYTAFPEFPATGHPYFDGVQISDVHLGMEANSHIQMPSRPVSIGAQAQDQDLGGNLEDFRFKNHLTVHTIPMTEVDSISVTSRDDEEESDARQSPTRPSSRRSLRHTTSIGKIKALKRQSSDPKHLSSKRFESLTPSKIDSIKKSSTPRVTIESPHISPSEKPQSRRGSKDSSESSLSIRRSPWPSRKAPVTEASPEVRRTIDFSSNSRESSRSPSLSPAFASLNSRIASMRAQINQSLSFAPGIDIGRTLGSELGSDFGDDWDKGVRSLEDIQWNQPHLGSPSPPSRRTNHSSLAFGNGGSGSDNELDNDIGEETGIFSPVYQPSYPLPPTVSAALSSLALALAPTAIFSDEPESSILASSQDTSRRDANISSSYTLVNPNSIKGSQTTALESKDTSASISAARSTLAFSQGTIVSEYKPGKVDSISQKGNEDERQRLPVNSVTFGQNSARRRISFARTTKDTPRKFALAHRRINSSNYQARHVSEKSADDIKGKGKIHENAFTDMKPDQTLTKKGIHALKSSLKQSSPSTDMVTVNSELREKEPSTVPAKVVHDVFCVISIWLEYIEWFIILAIRICIDIRSGPRGPSGLRKGDRPKRYYI